MSTGDFVKFFATVSRITTGLNMTKKKRNTQVALPFAETERILPAPDFFSLLRKPSVKLALPGDFDAAAEAEHLEQLWNKAPKLRTYRFDQFIHAGGSGIVFRVKEIDSPTAWAMKVARKKNFRVDAKAQGTLPSPFSDAEISALQQITHPNIVSLRDRIETSEGVVALVTTYVSDPQPLDEYLRKTLSQDPDPQRKRGLVSFSPERLEKACSFLVARCEEMASALAYILGLATLAGRTLWVYSPMCVVTTTRCCAIRNCQQLGYF
jgi:hypothetical protein